MRTNIVLNDELVQQAFLYAPTVKTIKDLCGMDLFSEDYDYKNLREEEYSDPLNLPTMPS